MPFDRRGFFLSGSALGATLATAIPTQAPAQDGNLRVRHMDGFTFLDVRIADGSWVVVVSIKDEVAAKFSSKEEWWPPEGID